MPIELDKARAAGYSDADILNGYAASKNFDLAGARAAGYSDKEILDRLAVPPVARPSQPRNYGNPVEVGAGILSAAQRGLENVLPQQASRFVHNLGNADDAFAGVKSGVASTLLGGYNLARKIPGAANILPEPSPQVAALAEPPQNFAGKAGKLLEQGAEFAVPIGAAGNALKLAKAPLAARIAGEAAAAALTTGVQTGGDSRAMGESGLTAGALAGAGAALGAGARTLLKGGANEPLSAELLRKSGEAEYARFLNPTTKGNKLRTAAVVPELIDRGVTAITRKGFAERVGGEVEKAGQALEDHYASLPDDAVVPLQPIKNHLARAADEAFMASTPAGKRVAMSPVAESGVKHVTDLAKKLDEYGVPDSITGEQGIPVGTARRLRQYYDSVAQDAGRYDGKALADQTTASAHAMAADAIRNVLASEYPDIAALNKEFKFWSDVNRVTQDTLLRKQGQSKGLIRAGMGVAGTAAGAVAGGLHGAFLGKVAMEGLEDLTQSPAWRTVGAVWKDRLADAIAKGQQGQSSFLINKISKMVAGQGPNVSGGTRPNVQTTSPARVVDAAQGGSAGTAAAGTTAEAAAANAGGIEQSTIVPQPAGTVAPGSRETLVTVPGQAGGYKASYKLRELEDVQPSHIGATFQPNPKYQIRNDRNYANSANQRKIIDWSAGPSADNPGFDPKYHVNDSPTALDGPLVTDAGGNVLGGNGRGMILQRVYQGNPAGAQAYRQLLEQKAARFGLDPAAVRAMKRPVLTREIADAELAASGARQKAVTDFNVKGTADLTPSERAIADARRVSPDTLDHFAAKLDQEGPEGTLLQALEGRKGVSMLKRLISDGVIAPQEGASLYHDTGLTKAGKQRVEGLMLGRFFNNPEEMDSLAPAIKAKLERLAAPLARVEGDPAWNLSGHVADAISLIEEAKGRGLTIDDLLSQSNLFGNAKHSPEAVTLAKQLQTDKPLELLKKVRGYAEHAKYAREYQGPGMFGEFPEPHLPGEAWQKHFEGAGAEYFHSSAYPHEAVDILKEGHIRPHGDPAEFDEETGRYGVSVADTMEQTYAQNRAVTFVIDPKRAPKITHVDELGPYANELRTHGDAIPATAFKKILIKPDKLSRSELEDLKAAAAKRGIPVVAEGPPMTDAEKQAMLAKRNAAWREQVQQQHQEGPEIGEHGPIYRQFLGKPREALRFVRDKEEGIAEDAIQHVTEGGMGLHFGFKGSPERSFHDGHGISHIDHVHPGFLDEHVEKIANMPVVKRFFNKDGSPNGLLLSDGRNLVKVSKNWNLKATKAWVVNAYDPLVPRAKFRVPGASD